MVDHPNAKRRRQRSNAAERARRQRRQRAVGATPEPESDDYDDYEDDYPSRRKVAWPPATIGLTLVAGLAVGYIVGREVSLRSEVSAPPATAIAAAPAAPAAPAPAAQGDGKQPQPAGCGEGKGQQPTGPAYVALASFNARKGPNPAKVTVVEFSDFQ